jgi:AbrB family looped-hinge helix DNA binding protein
MDYYRVVSSRGQVTIPAEIRKTLGLQARDRVTFRLESGHVVLQRTPSVTEFSGKVKLKGFKSMKQLRRETAAAVAERALERAGIQPGR